MDSQPLLGDGESHVSPWKDEHGEDAADNLETATQMSDYDERTRLSTQDTTTMADLLGKIPKRQRPAYNEYDDSICGYIKSFLLPRHKVSMTRGVLIPACIGLIGPTLYLRISYILSQAGLLLTLLMVVIITIVGLLFISSVSAIVTNGRMLPGGPYFLTSRTLGAELGGAIGVLIATQHVIAAVYFLATMSEIIQLSSADITGPTDYSYNYSHGILISTLFLFACLGMTLMGIRRYSTVAVLLFALKFICLFIVLGSFLFADPFKPALTDQTAANATSTIQFFTGPSSRSFDSNVLQHEAVGSDPLDGNGFENFLTLFSIVFAAFSGMSCGPNLTGSVKNPSRAIPQGMLYAALLGTSLYIIFALLLSGTMWKLYLVPHDAREVVLRVTVSEWVVIIGMMASCIGTTVVHLTAAATIIRFMTLDGLIPGVNEKRFPWLRRSPSHLVNRWHVFTAWLITQCVVFVGSPIAVAPFLSLVYLFFTSTMSGGLFLLICLGSPNFRPQFKFFSRYTALVGTVFPLAVMFGIDVILTLIFIGIFLVLLIIFSFVAPPSDFGEISRAIIFHQVRKYLLVLGKKKSLSNRFWRPSLLLLETQDPNFLSGPSLNLIRYCNQLKKGGLFLISSVVRGDYNSDTLAERSQIQSSWEQMIRQTDTKALPVTTIAPTARAGVQHALMLSGLGSMRPNTLVLNWLGTSALINPTEYLDIMRDTLATEMTLLVCRNFALLDFDRISSFRASTSKRKGIAERDSFMTIDVWACPLVTRSAANMGLVWKEYEPSVTMALQLASNLRMKSFWKDNTRVRVLTLVSRANDMEAEYLRWEAFLRHIRIQAFVEVLPLEASLRDMGVEVPRDLPPVRPPPVFGEDEGVESPIAMMGLSSRSPYFKLTPEQRLGLVRSSLELHTERTAQLFFPMPPMPTAEDGNLGYLRELQILTENAPPSILVHAKQNVIFTDL